MSKQTIIEKIGIVFTEVSEECVSATMPVDHRTHQPFGILHGGASVVLAETLGSVATLCNINLETQNCVGLEVNANHIRSKREGQVLGKATPINRGKKIQVWEIKITDEEENLVCISRITMAVINKPKQ
ncbi:MAG: hotdog fold thioesterase [Bacteroidetes bacterium]|nr:hotdog fold thioesterase [Bacteroidota bacterium]